MMLSTRNGLSSWADLQEVERGAADRRRGRAGCSVTQGVDRLAGRRRACARRRRGSRPGPRRVRPGRSPDADVPHGLEHEIRRPRGDQAGLHARARRRRPPTAVLRRRRPGSADASIRELLGSPPSWREARPGSLTDFPTLADRTLGSRRGKRRTGVTSEGAGSAGG